jgi:CheY-like chemotaxis protein
MINLLSNAVKYNRPGGTVTLECAETDDGMVRFTVTDTGPGIPAEKQERLFRPFQRLGRETSTVEGTGIGLSITRELMTRMKGRIGFDSAPGGGSRFWVDFPQASRVDEGVVGRESEEAVDELTSGGVLPAFAGEKTVLYVEDNPANMQLMRRVFRDLPGCRLLSAMDAETGLTLAEEHRPDLVLMDIHLPGMSGLQALGVLNEREDTRHIPVVAVTAAAMDHDRRAGLEAGFSDYLTKPFNVQEVVQTVARHLGGDGGEG